MTRFKRFILVMCFCGSYMFGVVYGALPTFRENTVTSNNLYSLTGELDNSGDYRPAVHAYMNDQLRNHFFEFVLTKDTHDGPVRHLGFKVQVQGVEIEGAYVRAHVIQGQIRHISGSRLDELYEHQFKGRFLLSEDEATDRVQEHFGIMLFDSIDIRAVYVFHQSSIHTAYRVSFTSRQLQAPSWRTLIDAETGEVLESESLVSHLTGKGRVFLKNRVQTPKITNVDLINLTGNGRLIGKYAHVINAKQKSTSLTSLTHVFNFEPERTEFAEVAAYYHANIILPWFESNGASLRGKVIRYYVHETAPGVPDKGWNNAYYDTRTKSVHVGDGDGLKTADGKLHLQNLSLEQDVFFHESVHHFIFDHGGVNSLQGESGGIHEGVADFFTFHLAGDACLAESAMADGSKCIRSAENAYKIATKLDKDVHNVGDIVSGALWDVHKQLDTKAQEKYAVMILKALPFIGNPQAKFKDFFSAVMQSDKTHYNSEFRCRVGKAMVERRFDTSSLAADLSSCQLDPTKVKQNLQLATAIKQEETDKEAKGKEEEDDSLLGMAGCRVRAQQSSAATVFILCLCGLLFATSRRFLRTTSQSDD